MRSIFVAAAIWQLANGQGSNGTEGENEPLPPNDLALTPPMGCKNISLINSSSTPDNIDEDVAQGLNTMNNSIYE